MKKLSQRSFVIFAIIGGILLHYVLTHYEVLPLVNKALAPVVGGFIIAYMLDPMVRVFVKLGKGKIKRGVAILLSVFIVILSLSLMISVLVPSIQESVVSITANIQKLVNSLLEGEFDFTFFENFVNRFKPGLFDDLLKQLQSSLQDILLKIGEWTQSLLEGSLVFLTSISSSVINFFLAFVVGLYMLAGKADLTQRVKRLNFAIFDKHVADELVRVTNKANEIFSSFFVGKIIDSAIVGVIAFVLVWVFQIPNAPTIGFIIGLTNIIPYFGPFIGAVPAILLTLASGSLVKALILLGLIVAIQQFDGLVLGPKILGDKVGVGAFWIIVSVTAGGAIAGVVGMLIGVPVVVLAKTLIEEYVERQLKNKKIDV